MGGEGGGVESQGNHSKEKCLRSKALNHGKGGAGGVAMEEKSRKNTIKNILKLDRGSQKVTKNTKKIKYNSKKQKLLTEYGFMTKSKLSKDDQMDLYACIDGQTDKENSKGLEGDETDGMERRDEQIEIAQFDVKARKRKL